MDLKAISDYRERFFSTDGENGIEQGKQLAKDFLTRVNGFDGLEDAEDLIREALESFRKMARFEGTECLICLELAALKAGVGDVAEYIKAIRLRIFDLTNLNSEEAMTIVEGLKTRLENLNS